MAEEQIPYIAFCGVGALGSLTATLCRNLKARLCFIDFDRVESKNLLSQAFVKASIGKNKAEALKLQFLNFYNTKTEAFGVRLADTNVTSLLSSASLIVDCFDNYASRQILSLYARSYSKSLVHAAISGDGTFGLVRWDTRFQPDAEDHAGQATCEGGEHLPLIACVASTLARTIQDFITHQTQRDSMISLTEVRATVE